MPSRAHRLDGVGGRVEQLVEPLDLVRRELREHVVAAVADRIADPDAQAAELLGAELVDDRAQAVVPAMAARLAETQLAERQREVVRDDEEVAERGVLAVQDLADRLTGLVHVGQRLDEGQVQAAVATTDDVRAVALAPTAIPAGPLSEPIHDQPADVVAGPGVLRTRVPETDDDLQRFLRGQHDVARIPSDRDAQRRLDDRREGRGRMVPG